MGSFWTFPGPKKTLSACSTNWHVCACASEALNLFARHCYYVVNKLERGRPRWISWGWKDGVWGMGDGGMPASSGGSGSPENKLAARQTTLPSRLKRRRKQETSHESAGADKQADEEGEHSQEERNKQKAT